MILSHIMVMRMHTVDADDATGAAEDVALAADAAVDALPLTVSLHLPLTMILMLVMYTHMSTRHCVNTNNNNIISILMYND